jgi:integrase
VWRKTVGDPKTAKSKAPVPVIPQLAQRLDAHRRKRGNPVGGPIFANSAGHPLDLNACYQREMKDVLKRAGISWHGWHGFRRGLASNLNRLGVDDSVIQRILRHSTVATTQNHYIKTASSDAIAAMRQFSALLCSTCAPDAEVHEKGSVQ